MINIKEKEKCCGCSACDNICPKNCITMHPDNEGFLYPNVNMNECVECSLCEQVCPILSNEIEKPFSQKAYLIQNKDPKVLSESTSGGAFSALAEYILKENGVVYGAAFNSSFEVVHQGIQNPDELCKFRNSKYVQSRIEKTFLEAKVHLDAGRKVLYSGTPCQIEGLKRFLRKDYTNLITVDVVCHAVPSPLIWEKYKQFRTSENMNLLEEVAFRDKEYYGYEYSQMTIKLRNGRKLHFGVESDPYLRAFFSDLSDRPSCYNCQFKKRYRVCDITIWDCFDVFKFSKSLDNNKGVTRALVHTEKGNKLLQAISEKCVVVEVDPDFAVKGVRELVKSVQLNPRRKQFFEDANRMSNKEFFEFYFPSTLRVKAEYLIRISCIKLGIYQTIKRLAKKVLKRN